MEIYTVEEFQQNWDELINRVEGGEYIGITNGKNTCIMIPADDESLKIYNKLNYKIL